MYIKSVRSLRDHFSECECTFKKGHDGYFSGFVQFPSGKCVYYCSVSFGGNRYLVRTAKDMKDFTGGRNQYTKGTSKEEFFELVRKVSLEEHRAF